MRGLTFALVITIHALLRGLTFALVITIHALLDTAWRYSFEDLDRNGLQPGDVFGFSDHYFGYGNGIDRELRPIIQVINEFTDWFFGITSVDYDYGEAAPATRQGTSTERT